MGVAAGELIVPFTGAIQAAFSVLLTIAFGVVAAQCNLLSPKAAKEVSKLCVRMFLPALLIYKIGSNLHQDTGVRYVPVLIWSISYTLLSVFVGRLLTRIFKLPAWVAPAIAFNNTTSLPLLLIQSLKQTQILDAILIGGESGSQAMDRAESYFLVNAMVSNSLTFAIGPGLLRPGDEDASDEQEGEDDEDNGQANEDGESSDMERGPEGIIDEETSLLPQRITKPVNRIEKKGYLKTQKWYNNLSPWLQETLNITWQFANAPLLGAIVGAVIGLTPALHRLFFSPSNEGGYLPNLSIITRCLSSNSKLVCPTLFALSGSACTTSLAFLSYSSVPPDPCVRLKISSFMRLNADTASSCTDKSSECIKGM
jgi:predicted permease